MENFAQTPILSHIPNYDFWKLDTNEVPVVELFEDYVLDDVVSLENILEVKVSVDGDKKNTYRFQIPFMSLTEAQIDQFDAELEIMVCGISLDGIELKYKD